MKDLREVIIRPVLTEKAMEHKEKYNKVTFEVARDANKLEVKQAVEQLFGVKVEKVNIITVHGKRRYRFRRLVGKEPDWKKAVVTLKPGYTIELFEGV